ncbi:hypothetical protein PF011_g22676 [Phytophthora fragariae]|uniref:Uncharacterized protein n=1 Tax=Phytophthora fragariae TaxID=53985 RepID=A0A6A3ID36_9STRA|nr:hypothetical protein PF011_g22676 [Phytophthora fragariae]
MVPVKVGDVLEFDALSASKDGGGGSSSPTKTEGRSLTTGRVVEVNPEDEGGGVTCTVQVSPYEPLQPLDLKRTFYKVVYEADALRSLSSEMVGWEIELESADTKHLERGVIKQVDCDINCALVLFAEGRKEWLDLTFFRVKISGHQPSPRDSNADGVAKESTKPHNTGDDTSGISDSITPSSPHNFHVAVSSLSMPRIDPDAFDWHLEGTHVELCNRDGHFLEVHPIKNDSTPPKPDQAQSLFRIPSGEISHDLEYTLPKTSPIPNPVSEPEVPVTGGGPGRKPPPGKRAALHRRASQSADVPKTSLPAEPTEPPVQPSPIKEESPLAQAVPPIKPLSPLQSPRIDSHQMRPVSPGGPLPPVQPGSNSNSPSKTQLPTQVGAHEHPGS